jgi:Polyketide cyclase / dehydrase and lipid transport
MPSVGTPGAGIANVQPMTTVEVSRVVHASPERAWAVVSDPVGMSDLTDECVDMAWVTGSTGPTAGARFRGRNRSGWRRWTTSCTITRYEAGTEIAWDVAFGPLAVARWSYRVEPGTIAGTSVVTERFADHRGTVLRATSPLIRGTADTSALNRSHMEATLDRVKRRAEA